MNQPFRCGSLRSRGHRNTPCCELRQIEPGKTILRMHESSSVNDRARYDLVVDAGDRLIIRVACKGFVDLVYFVERADSCRSRRSWVDSGVLPHPSQECAAYLLYSTLA